MSVHRFVCYFLALSACATIAFASSLLDQAAAHAGQGPAESAPLALDAPPLYASMSTSHWHKAVPAHLQVAQAH